MIASLSLILALQIFVLGKCTSFSTSLPSSVHLAIRWLMLSGSHHSVNLTRSQACSTSLAQPETTVGMQPSLAWTGFDAHVTCSSSQVKKLIIHGQRIMYWSSVRHSWLVSTLILTLFDFIQCMYPFHIALSLLYIIIFQLKRDSIYMVLVDQVDYAHEN